MMKITALLVLSVVALCNGSPTAPATINLASKGKAGTTGIIDEFYKCGGYGTFVQLRISDCAGRCQMYPTKMYQVEADYFPSQALDSLTVGVDLVFNGSPTRIMEVLLANSSVQPGYLYTVRFTVVPNDILAGEVATFRAVLFRTSDRLLETCVMTEIDILPYP